jgi:uncharacterized protein YdeI (YjbR/CyaY-like superfamily)
MEALYFRSPPEMRKWLEKNHSKATELIAGYYKKASGKESITWEESVEEAICFGWIDGIRRSVDEERYTNRFTPRKATSNWSLKNIATAEALIRNGKMQPAGLAAFQKRKEEKSGIYSFEKEALELTVEFIDLFKQNKKAWEFYSSQAPSYRKTAVYWVMSAKQEKTRRKRLQDLIEASEQGQKPAPFRVSSQQ